MLNDGTRVIDVIPFFDEIDLLEIRLNVLDPIVDFFLISEFSTTFSGNKKEFNFSINQSRFKSFKEKIIYLPKIHENFLSPFEEDAFQKNAIKEDVLAVSASSDLIIFGDLDEIPNPEIFEKANKLLNKGFKIIHCAQTPFYGFLNYKDVSGKLLSYAGEYPLVFYRKWLGSVIFRRDLLNQNTMTNLRDPSQKKHGRRMAKGGWHFSYCGGLGSDFLTRITYKIESSAHQELNNFQTKELIAYRIENNEDFLGRTNKTFFRNRNVTKFRKVKINYQFPKYIRENIEKYQHLIHDYN